MTNPQSLQHFAHSRQAILDTLEKLNTAELTEPQVEGVWTVKDILGHLASWEEVCLIPLRSFAQGGPFQTETLEDAPWNDIQAARGCCKTLSARLSTIAGGQVSMSMIK